MNTSSFTDILKKSEHINEAQTNALKSIITAHPYCQSARALYLKGLKNQDSFKYNYALKTTAAYTTDRSVLFEFITSDEFLQNEISEFIKQNATHLKDIDTTDATSSIDKKVTIDDTLKQQIKDTSGVLDPQLFQPKEKRNQNIDKNIPSGDKKAKTDQEKANEILNIGAPLEFNKAETHSFNEWLKIAKLKPIERETPAPEEKKSETQQKREDKFKLIEDFIAKNPKINPKKQTSTKGNIAKAQMIKPEALMTETLARIYVEQGNYKKAIQSYRILSLKYPKKSGLFADQIKAIELLQEQNNKE